MFFSIQTFEDRDFPYQFLLSNGMTLNVDSGWTKSIEPNYTVYSKGYSDTGKIDINNQSQGNYIAIVDDGDLISITHDIDRATPINLIENPTIVTNLPMDASERIFENCQLSIDQQKTVSRKYSDTDVNIEKISKKDALDKIDTILTERFRSFLSNNKLPIKVFLSGGLDTMLVYSYLKKLTDNYELCDYEHTDITHFYTKKKDKLLQYWGYKQIHHWRDSCVLVTGACGDEFMLRSPSHMMLFLMHWNLSLDEIMSPEDHHYEYLTNPDKRKKYQLQEKDPEWILVSKSYQAVCKKIIHMNLNDNQHWHLENTLTFTPLKDIEITKTLMGMPQDDLLAQLKNGDFTRELITRNDKSLLQYLSNQKNTNNQENLVQLYDAMRSSTI